MTESQTECVVFVGELCGHNEGITCILTIPENPEMLITGSRDRTIIVWKVDTSTIKKSTEKEYLIYGIERKLTGHNSCISDISISSDRKYLLSSSWDKTVRLWNLTTGKTVKHFIGHKNNVLSVAFSCDDKQIVSSSSDHAINLWNCIGVCKQVKSDNDIDGHTDNVTRVRFSPNAEDNIMVSTGRDNIVKVWKMTDFTLKHNLKGHTSYINALIISPDGSLIATGDKNIIILWDIHEGRELGSYSTTDEVYCLCFSPTRYWVCAATGSDIKIWDLETKYEVASISSFSYTDKRKQKYTCLEWSSDGKTLYIGRSDNKIEVWAVKSK